MIVALGASMFGSCNKGGAQEQQQQNTRPKEAPFALVGTTELVPSMIATGMESIQKQYGGNLEADLFPAVMGNAMQVAINDAVAVEAGKKNGVTVDDAEAVKSFDTQWESSMPMARMQMIQQGQLKPNSTQADFEKAVKDASGGKTLAEIKTEKLAEFKKALADPATRSSLLSQLIEKGIDEKLAASLKISDEDLKHSRDLYEVRRVFSKDQKKIEKALAEIKAGTAFKDAMAKFSEDVPQPPKTIKETTINVPMANFYGNDKLAIVKTLKADEDSPIIPVDNGFAVYRMVKVTVTNIPDFEKQKESIRKDFEGQIATQKREAMIRNLTKELKPDWKIDSFRKLFELNNPKEGATKEELKKQKIALIEEPSATYPDEVSTQADVYVRFKAISDLWKEFTPAEKTKYTSAKLEIYGQFLSRAESVKLRLEMADLLMEKNDPLAVEQILQAALGNIAFEPKNQQDFANIAGALIKLKAAKLGTAEQLADIQKALDRWKSDKMDHDKQVAAEKKAQAEEKAKFEAEQKKAAEEAKKKAAEDLKNKVKSRDVGGPPKTMSSKDLTGSGPLGGATTGK
ncbi:MAG: hypothetical protein K8R88_15785 [Armatimonadetes bacterium]|nr:hypothetical protein [Armatimonadota bacterium]